MSKSDNDSKGRIELTDSEDEIRNKIRKSVTDSKGYLTFDPANRPGISNLISIHAALSNVTPEQICERNLKLDTVSYKDLLAEVIIERLKPIRVNIQRLLKERQHLVNIINTGNDRANNIASKTYDDVKRLIGFI